MVSKSKKKHKLYKTAYEIVAFRDKERNKIMCVFCQIINKEAEAKIVYESSKVIAFLDIEPINTGHILVLPKIHENTITRIPEDYLMEVIGTVKKIACIYESDYGHTGYSVMQNGGECCDFGHFHMHIFPRKSGDGFGWTYPSIGGEYSDKVADDIRKRLADNNA